MSQLAGYIGPISTAMWVFPFVALLFTVPYVISSYRRYGAVLFFRALVVRFGTAGVFFTWIPFWAIVLWDIWLPESYAAVFSSIRFPLLAVLLAPGA